MNDVFVSNYWAGRGSKLLYSDSVELDSKRAFKKIISSFPPSDDFDIAEKFKAVWVFQCKDHGPIFLGWIYSAGKAPGKNYVLPSYHAIIVESNLDVEVIVEKLKRGPHKRYGAQDSTQDFLVEENADFFSENIGSFPINDNFTALLQSQKSNGELLRCWAENPTNSISHEKELSRDFGPWRELDEKVSLMTWEGLTAGPTDNPSVNQRKEEASPNTLKGRLLMTAICTIAAIAVGLGFRLLKNSDPSPKLPSKPTTTEQADEPIPPINIVTNEPVSTNTPSRIMPDHIATNPCVKKNIPANVVTNDPMSTNAASPIIPPPPATNQCVEKGVPADVATNRAVNTNRSNKATITKKEPEPIKSE